MQGSQGGLLADGQAMTIDEVDLAARRAASLFHSLGIGEGAFVALLLRNRAPFIIASLGARHLGALVVPINWHFTPSEIRYILQDCGARVLVVEPDLLGPLAPHLPAGLTVLTADTDWDDRLAAAAPLTGEPRPPRDSIVYTSGTTGRPKGVLRLPGTPEQRSAADRVRQQIYNLRPGARVLMPAPLYHSAPNFFALATLQREGLLVLHHKFDAAEMLRAIAAHGITHLFMVPTMFIRLLALPATVRHAHDLSSLHWVLHAGAPCPPQIKAAMIDWWGPVINEYYGSTEMGPITFVGARDWLGRKGTVGRPVDGAALAIVDERGDPCSPGTAGEIHLIRSAQPDFTYNGDDGKRRAMDSAHGLASGDIGFVDEDGFLFICDRRTDMIISGGVNIYPAEIEAELMRIPGVRDCAVIGRPDPEFGESVAAFVELDPDGPAPSEAEMLSLLKARIARYKVPRTIGIVPSLPRDDNGKIYKRRLRDEPVGAGPR